MTPTRRDFLATTGLAVAGLASGAAPSAAHSAVPGRTEARKGSADATRARAPKRILIFGGTGFIGPHTVRYAVERGHEVSIFTRGRTEADLPDVEHLVGDRNGDHSALEGRRWDVVMDNNTSRDYRWVQRSTDLLRDAAEQYLFISSISAYDLDGSGDAPDRVRLTPAVGTDHPLAQPPAGWQDGEPLEYGPMKAYAEEIVRRAFPGRATVVRPGLIVGPGDPTDRFTYWPDRISRGGEVLAPGNPRHATQIIDQRDLTEWTVRLVEDGITGDFNAVGPASRLAMAEMLYGIRAAFAEPVSFTWVPEDFLAEQEVRPWQDLPAWIPGAALMFVDHAASLEAGLTYRPLAVTAADTQAWNLTRTDEDRRPTGFGMSREREAEVLAAWRARNG
ncbi:MAG: NAD-dependent epimerase/dehydratase family protein [Longimicrobiales bacterium]|nr:NAD-dependent epimerase/dehydratase family protein [Longimicrobiales bacterium]